MKVGIIGAGGMGADHCLAVKILSENRDIEVVAIADKVEKNCEKARELWPDARYYEDGAALIEAEKNVLDTVHIAVPSFLHTDLAISAMDAGLDVLLEKPACLTEDDCDRLLEAQKRNHVKVMVGQVVRFYPEYALLKEIYEDGRYGKLKGLSLQRLGSNIMWGVNNWFHDEKKSGSVVMDLHIHDTDFIRYLLGEPKDISVEATAYENGMINHILTQFKYPGMMVSAEGGWDVSPNIPFHVSFRAYFEKATLDYIRRRKPDLIIYGADGTIEVPEINPMPEPGSYLTEIEYFYDCLEKGEEPAIADLEEGLKTVRLGLSELRVAHAFIENNRE